MTGWNEQFLAWSSSSEHFLGRVSRNFVGRRMKDGEEVQNIDSMASTT